MDFDPNNHVVKHCIEGMALAGKGKPDEAIRLFLKAWDEAATDFEKFIAAHFVARHQKNDSDRLAWFKTDLQLALKIDNASTRSAVTSLYESIARCYENLNDHGNANKNYELAKSFVDKPSDNGPFYHGTKADLQIGDFLTAGHHSNYQSELLMNHIYFTALINGAGLAAGLAKGDGRERVYVVEATGSFEHDPNVTNKKFPGNPTRSYRTEHPLKIVGEITDWARQTVDDLQKWREKLANNKGEIIN